DPYPVFSSLYPNLFLYTYYRETLKGLPCDRVKQEWFNISISGFGQNATCGTRGLFSCNPCATPPSEQCTAGLNITPKYVDLGDLGDRWSMIGLLFGAIPEGETLPQPLVDAHNLLFPTVPIGTPITDCEAIDPQRKFGFFSVPIEYKKRGVRFDFEGQILRDFGFEIQIGVADIITTATFVNRTPANVCSISDTGTQNCTNACFDCNNPNLTSENINSIMCNYNDIADSIHLDIDNFHQTSVEDIRVGLYWRRAFLMNEGSDNFPEFLFIPWITVAGAGAISNEHHRNRAFAVPFSNDNHNAVGFMAGMDFDFTETIDIGWEFGLTHFFKRSFCNVPVPTSPFQSGWFPFQTDVTIQPGNNWNFGASLFAYHFLHNLSFHFQWMLTIHKDDHYCLIKPDPAFMPEILEDRSTWLVHVGNMGFNYDISPYISLGFLWQAPLAQRNAYRSTTLLFSFNATY
ncbi:MAG TPA: hypothetical protein VFF04_00600, partial [Candidatus Babeliales bacterium]|nr:hypothetical protein [Candidatus Babeliales bacterium]